MKTTINYNWYLQVDMDLEVSLVIDLM